MNVKLIFDAQFIGRVEYIADIQSNYSDDDIKSLFPIYIGVNFDNNCSYEIMGLKS